jgi:hypothetical protein
VLPFLSTASCSYSTAATACWRKRFERRGPETGPIPFSLDGRDALAVGIITRDKDGFLNATIPVMTPTELLNITGE